VMFGEGERIRWNVTPLVEKKGGSSEPAQPSIP